MLRASRRSSRSLRSRAGTTRRSSSSTSRRVGAFFTQYNDTWEAIDPSQSITALWAVLDTQVCPLDIPLGSTGLSVLGCGRMGAALTQFKNYNSSAPLMGWAGGGGRLRWQSPWRLFTEIHVNGVEVTQSTGWSASNSGWLDVGAMVGLLL